MREVNKIAEELFDKIRSRFEHVSVGDEAAKSTSDPSESRFFNFDYTSKAGNNFGNITISIADEHSLKIYFSKGVTENLTDEEREEWYEFLRNLRHFAKRNMLTFDTRDITRDNLNLRDLKQVSKADSTLDTSDITIAESRMFGSTKSSYQNLGPVNLLVRHSDNIDENIHGARTRNIEAIFVETQLGERFLLPFNKLTPARAMARHISNGGIIQDDIGNHIVSVVKEMSDMNVFVRNMRRRTFEDAETMNMVEAATERYNELKSKLVDISGQKGYGHFKETFSPQDDSTIMEDDFDIDALKERFVKKIFDDRLSEALPHVYRAYKNKQLAKENSYVSEFDDWASNISEGNWAMPDSDDAEYRLRELMSKPLLAGANGNNAISALDDAIGSDDLVDAIHKASEGEQGADTDVRPLIISWLNTNGFEELAQEFEQAAQNADMSVPQPGQLTPQANQPAPMSPPVQQPDMPPAAQPAQESIDHLKRLAGLV